MRALSVMLKIIAAIFMVLALLAFGSDFLPVEGISFGGGESEGGGHQFYKVVSTDGSDPTKFGFVYLFVSIILFGLAVLINKYMSNKSGT